MKKFILSAMIVAAAATVGCSKTNTETQTKEAREIHLSSSMSDLSASSKVAFNSGDAVTGLWFMRRDGTTKPTGGDTGNNTFVSGDRTDDLTNIAFATPQYYNGKDNAYFMGYYPKEDEVSSNALTFKITDGKRDIMFTDTYDAGTDAVPVVPTMVFKHAMAQVDVVCKAEAGNIDAVKARWGQISHIKIKDALTTLVLSNFGQPAFELGDKADLTLAQANYTDDFVAIDIPADNNTTTNAAGMFSPTTTQTFDLLVKTASQDERTVTIDLGVGNKLEAGKKHVITLTFNTKSINIKTTIEDWGTGAPGAAEVN